MSYAGDVSCKQCWETLQEDNTAQLVDVRTVPEWNLVGVPSLEQIGKKLITSGVAALSFHGNQFGVCRVSF